MEVARGVLRLTLGVCNWYLVEDGGRFTLVDAGAPKDWPLLLDTLRGQGKSLDDVDAVLLTHAHPDHTGFAERARSEGNAEVRVHDADVAVAKGGKQEKNARSVFPYLFRGEMWRTAMSLMRRGGTKIVPIAEVSRFADGDAIDVPGRPRVVHVPGHTPGSSALVLEDRGVLLTGDALIMRNPFTGRVGPQIAPDGLNRDGEEALRSLAKLETISADTVLTGHGEPFTDGVAEAVRLAREAGRS